VPDAEPPIPPVSRRGRDDRSAPRLGGRNVLKRPSELGLREFHGLLTRDPAMERLFVLVERAARASSAILIRGETGTGKDLVARAIHQRSPRAGRPFQAVNCATLSPTLLESELFGHTRGAFTGAIRDHPGLFLLADGGTIFLDELGEMPLEIQAKLLRVLEEKTFVPVGGTKAIRVDVRLVSATHRALRTEVAAARFRADLFYRVRVVPLFLPPLRLRSDDVEPLLWWFIDQSNREGLRRIEGVSRVAMDALRSYSWPGNVRELRNVVEYASIVGEGPVFDLEDLTPEIRGEPPPATDATEPGGSLVDGERGRILAALARHRGRKGLAARDLGMSRSTLWRKLYQHRLL
jgi:two-component system, NtrC family, response regulator AtoC